MFNIVHLFKFFVATIALVGALVAGPELAKKVASDIGASTPVIVAEESGGTGSGSTGGGTCC